MGLEAIASEGSRKILLLSAPAPSPVAVGTGVTVPALLGARSSTIDSDVEMEGFFVKKCMIGASK